MSEKSNSTKSKYKAAAVLLAAALASQPVYSTGIPVFDGAQEAQAIWEKGVAWVEKLRQFQLQLDRWNEQRQNWQNLIRGKIAEFFGIKLSDTMSQAELAKIWEKGRTRCNQISNDTSKSYCNQMITLEIEKINLYFEGENSIDEQWKQFMSLRDSYNTAQSTGSNNANQLQSISENMEKVLNKIEIDMKVYEQRIALLDTRIKWMREARVKIAQEQMLGTNRTIVDNVSKAAVVGTLTVFADKNRREARNLRERNERESQKALQNNM